MGLKLKHWQQLHRWRAGRFKNVALAVVPLIFRLKPLQEFHGSRAGRFQRVVLILALRAFVVKHWKSFTDWGRAVFNLCSRVSAARNLNKVGRDMIVFWAVLLQNVVRAWAPFAFI
eukprot:981652-Pyramimonas_sp.AAC.1